MTIHIQAAPRFENQFEPNWLREAALQTLIHLGEAENTDLTVAIVEDARIKELNKTYRGYDQPTDVLSFPSGDLDPETGIKYLGDIVIAFPQVVSQAQAGGHSISAELQLLTVHGVLHLLGFDHGDDAEKKNMWDIQAAVLTKLGCAITGPGD